MDKLNSEKATQYLDQISENLPPLTPGTQVSIVIPIRNEQEHLPQLLASLENVDAIDLTEIIFVNNGSTDNTRAILEGFIFHHPEITAYILDEEIAGYAYALKAGMDQAAKRKARYIVVTDADAVVPPHWIQTYIGIFSEDPSVLMIAGSGDRLSQVREKLHSRPEAYKTLGMLLFMRRLFDTEIKPSVRGPNMAITAEAYAAIGGCKPKIDPSSNKQLPGSDIGMEDDILAMFSGRSIVQTFNNSVQTSPRRDLLNLRKIMQGTWDGYVHDLSAQDPLSAVNNEDQLLNTVADIPQEVFNEFLERTRRRFFGTYFPEIYRTQIYKAKYWQNSIDWLVSAIVWKDRLLENEIPALRRAIDQDFANYAQSYTNENQNDPLWQKYGQYYIDYINFLYQNQPTS